VGWSVAWPHQGARARAGWKGKVKTGSEYLASIQDGRMVYFQGARVEDVTVAPGLREPAAEVARGYDRFFDPTPGSYHPMFEIPRSSEDLRARIKMVFEADFTAFNSAACLALLGVGDVLRKADPVYVDRIARFVDRCRTEDLRVAEVISDAKGDRSLPPSRQADPDAYLRVVERRSDGVVVNGAKLHITAAPFVHELVVMPTKRMKAGDEDYTIAFSIPANSPGISMVAVSHAPMGDDVRHFPVSGKFAIPQALVVFDHVFVPHEAIFLNGEIELSATIAHSLGLWERLSGLAQMAEHADMLTGLAHLISEANGVPRAPHIADTIAQMAIYATITRANLEASLTHADRTDDGMVKPNELYINAGKYYAAAEYLLMVRHLHDIAGASVVTSPSMADLDNPDIGAFVEKYMKGVEGVEARSRMALFHAIRDLTADVLAGWHLGSNISAGGGLMAQRLVTRNQYDMANADRLARLAAGLDS
jgi:4-hydroxybutyryl-CoA dehydratase/vinylacetyl-CoA-Delta-isomerase